MGLFSSGYDISGSGGYDINGGGAPVFGGPDVATSPSGYFDWLQPVSNVLLGGYSTVQTIRGRNRTGMAPESQVEYAEIPRDIAGPAVTNRGFAMSWGTVLLIGCVGFALLALKKT